MKRKCKSFKCLIDIYLPGTDVRHISFWRVFEVSEEIVRRAVREALDDLPPEVPYIPRVDVRCKHIVDGSAIDELKRTIRGRIVHAYRYQAAERGR